MKTANPTSPRSQAPQKSPSRGQSRVVKHAGERNTLLGLLGGGVFFAIWHCVSVSGIVPQRLFPSPFEVMGAFAELLASGYASDVFASVLRILVSFILASAVALPLGLALGASATFAAFASPTLSAFRYLPAPAFSPLLLMWLGPGDEQKVALLFLGVVWFLVVMIGDHVRAVRKDLIETALTLGARPWQIWLTVIAPAAAPRIWEALRQMLAVSWTYLVIAEIVAATNGIGAMMMRAQRFIRVDEVMVGILTIGCLGLLFDVIFRVIGRQMFHYEKNEQLRG